MMQNLLDGKIIWRRSLTSFVTLNNDKEVFIDTYEYLLKRSFNYISTRGDFFDFFPSNNSVQQIS